MQVKSINELANVLAKINNPKEMREFLQAILTPHERAGLALRWRLVCLLSMGVRQRTIARQLHISLCKITRGSRELKHGPKIFRKTVEKNVSRKAG